MIVAAHEDNAWLILDNATMVLATDSEDAIVYSPLFLLDKSGVRRYLGFRQLCCSAVLVATKRMLAIVTPSQIVSASTASFSCRFTYGFT